MVLGVPIFKPIYVHIIRLIAVLVNASATGNINFEYSIISEISVARNH